MNEAGTDADEVYIAAVGAQVEDVATKRKQPSGVLVYFLRTDAHLVGSHRHTPLQHHPVHEAHGLLLQHLLPLFLVELVLLQNLLHESGVRLAAFSLHHVEGLSVA